MKKILFTVTAVILIAMMLCPVVSAAGERGKALIIYGYVENAVGAGDKAVGARLETLGYAVDYVAAPDSTETSWNGYDVIFIGESVTSADVGTKMTSANTLVIVGEPGLYDEMLMGNYDSVYDSEAYTGTYKVINDIVGSGLTSFKGFKVDDVMPGFLLDYAEGVQVIAENEKGSPAVTIVKPGAKLTDGSAAVNYRASIFCRRQDAANFSDDAWKMFDAIIDFVYPPPVIEEVAAVVEDTPVATTAAPVAATVKSPQTADMSVIITLVSILSGAGLITINTKKRK